MFEKFLNWFSNDLAIDLGTANTLVYTKDRGIVVNEPSVVAVNRGPTGNLQILAVGQRAKNMLGRTPDSITAIKPIRDGVIADFEITQAMLKYFIQKSFIGTHFVKPRIIICTPYGITQVEKRAVRESAIQAGAREVYLVEEPMAAAIGAGLPVTEASGNMIIDIGGGTTEIAVISLGGIVFSKSIRVAGNKFDDAIINYVKKKYSLLIGERTAEDIKINIGNAYAFDDEIKTYTVKGRDLIAGAPKTIMVSSDEIRDALAAPVGEILEALKISLEKTPPELAADIVDNGIILSGGGSLLSNLDVLLKERTGLPIAIAEDPLTCVVRGCGKVLENISLLKQLTSDF